MVGNNSKYELVNTKEIIYIKFNKIKEIPFVEEI